METYKNLKKSTRIGLLVSFVLTFLCGVFAVFDLIRALDLSDVIFAAHVALILAMVVLIAVYALWAFKKPHGNCLRTLFLMFGISMSLAVCLSISSDGSTLPLCESICNSATALIVVFVSGRLHKIEENKILLSISGLFQIGHAVLRIIIAPPASFFDVFGICTPIFLLFAIFLAYVARYEEHKTAGLSDKADAEEN